MKLVIECDACGVIETVESVGDAMAVATNHVTCDRDPAIRPEQPLGECE